MMSTLYQVQAIIFDIDGTLAPEISWFALTRELGASADEHRGIYQDYRNGLITYSESKNRLLDIWRSTGNANCAVFRSIFADLSLDAAAQQVVDQLRDRYVLCLITGSMDLYAQVVAERLGIKQWFANATLHWDARDELADMDYELQQDAMKLSKFMEFCGSSGIQAHECVVVGDGENDLMLFEATGNGILVGENPPIQHRQRAWKTVRSLAELPGCFV